MKRLTIHLSNVEKITHNGKQKVFNTLAFKISSEKESNEILLAHEENVKKHYFSNI